MSLTKMKKMKRNAAKETTKTKIEEGEKATESKQEATKDELPTEGQVQPVHINIEPVIDRVLSVTIRGGILVAKPVDPAVATALSIYGEKPTRAAGKWTDKEKSANKRRERARQKLGKKGHYAISLTQLKMSNKPGYGIPSAAIMRAIQTANRNMPMHQVPEEQLNMAIEIVPHDIEKSLLRVHAKRGPFLKEDIVRIGHKEANKWKGTPSLAVRPAWIDWRISFDVQFTQNLIEGEQVFNLLMWAGRAGILEGRPSKGSALNWGRFVVEVGKDKMRRG